MARFHVGQRVRIKWSINLPELAGKSGIIVGLVDRTRPHDPSCEWEVIPDGYLTSIFPCKNVFSNFCPSSDQLEPLTDSYDLVSWESMRDLWVPEHLRIKA